MVFHFHDWSLWSAPKDSMWYNPESDKNVEGQIQDRTCHKCGKYQWRKI